MKYRVQLVQTIIKTAWVMVDADNAEQAEDRALAVAHGHLNDDNPLQWGFTDTLGDIEANIVEPAAA